MIGIVAYLAIVGSLVAVAARGAAEVLRLPRRPTRLAWVGGMALLVALTAWAPFRAAEDIVALPQVLGADGSSAQLAMPERGAVDRGVVDGALSSLAELRRAVASVPARVMAPLRSGLPEPVGGILLTGWLALSAGLVALLAVTYIRFSRASRRLPVTELQGATVRVSPTAGPAVVGVRQPEIVVPAWLLEAGAEEQQLAISHEREHLAARDPLLLIGGCIVVALLPWHPASWWMLARLRLAVEVDCDQRVLARGIARRSYGAVLIDIAGRSARLPLGVPALADHATQLQQRLIAMTPIPVPFRRTRTLAVGAAALLTLAAACEARLPTSPEVERMDVAAVEGQRMARVAFGTDTAVTYFVDGREASAAEARAVVAERIASIEVRKHAGAPSSIHLTTKAHASAADGAARAGEERDAVARIRDAGLYASLREIADSAGRLSPSVRVGKPMEERAATAQLAGPVKGVHADDFQGLVFIDGAKADGSALARLAATQIESIEVIKGAAASRTYTDSTAANGVIRVTTKVLVPTETVVKPTVPVTPMQ